MECKKCKGEIVGKRKTFCSDGCRRDYSQTVEGKYESYSCNARNRGKEFCLTLEEFALFWQKPCTYCGSKILTIGLDRIDNTKGYEIGNVAPCCTSCNMWKRTLTVEDFVAKCRIICDKYDTNHSTA